MTSYDLEKKLFYLRNSVANIVVARGGDLVQKVVPNNGEGNYNDP